MAIRPRGEVRVMLWALAASIALALVAGSGSVHAQSQLRTVEGVVQNATSGGGTVSDQTVTLHRVTSMGFDDLTTTTDGAGAFSFADFEYSLAVSYGVSVRYQDAIYGTDLDLATGSPETVVLTVYDGTSDDGIVSAGSASILLADADPSDQTLAALEIIRLVNRSDRAYVPGEGVMELLRFGLPPGATDLVLDTPLIGADFVQVDRGFALLASVPPGEHEVMFSYRFPYEASKFTLEKSYRYGAGKVRILAPEEVVGISSASLGPPSPVTIGERQYQVVEAEGLTRGAEVSIDLDGLPMASAGQQIGSRLPDLRFEYAAPAALVLLMVGLLIYGAVWKTARATPPSDTSPERGDLESHDDERAVIRTMIEDLAVRFETGHLDESDYRQRLRVLNARLTELARTDSV